LCTGSTVIRKQKGRNCMLFAQFWRKERFRSVAIKLSHKTCNGIAELFKLVPVELGFIHFF
jgi:hypothetical protein